VINDTTFQDVIDHGFDYLGGTPSEQVHRDCVRAALEAYRDLANCFNWSDLYTHSRVYTSGSFDGSQSDCTIQYQGTGGTYDRMVTLSGGVWPDWAAEGTYLRLASTDDYVGGATVGYVAYRVAERKSATVITLNETLCPDTDIPADLPGSDYWPAGRRRGFSAPVVPSSLTFNTSGATRRASASHPFALRWTRSKNRAGSRIASPSTRGTLRRSATRRIRSFVVRT
jgi:hypothetical protein